MNSSIFAGKCERKRSERKMAPHQCFSLAKPARSKDFRCERKAGLDKVQVVNDI